MNGEPKIRNLSHKRRKRFFWLLVVIFSIALPSLIFYTAGYRLSFENEETSIVTTGGIYITTDNLEVDVYLDEEQVERPRLFRSAYYIQNIEVGQHRVVVQRPDLHTWVKELPVYPHIVVEASAFNMPVIPHLRPITKYVTATGTQVYFGMASTTELFKGVTTTVPVLATTKGVTDEYEKNEEFVFVQSLFSTTSTSTRSVFDRFLDGVDRFKFATTSDSSLDNATTSVPVIENGYMRIIDHDGEIYATWLGPVSAIPYYFCVIDEDSSTTAFHYGDHVSDEIKRLTVSTTTPIFIDNDRLCRPEIRIDRMHRDVFFYDFFPNSSDLVLMQLEDGLYVTEIDDRSWQNTQLLYPSSDFRVVLENNIIFIEEDGIYFEVVTEIEPN